MGRFVPSYPAAPDQRGRRDSFETQGPTMTMEKRTRHDVRARLSGCAGNEPRLRMGETHA
ncbi:hypothetical protein Ato02nite_061730 [Paractinoplanes toevensis]|uniref:Uncharacterized protein n=1 Tax=Paractinoplanes toevensis TaxID=571911 RepID=A0A919TF31_9ACTN|nr:hypothetical protein Ato02nite_061730 [Actinoplanes toevensis]